MTEKQYINRQLDKAKVMENLSQSLENQAEKIRNTVARRLAGCKVGDLIEGGILYTDQGIVTDIYGNAHNRVKITYRKVRRGKVLQSQGVFLFPNTITVIKKGPVGFDYRTRKIS